MDTFDNTIGPVILTIPIDKFRSTEAPDNLTLCNSIYFQRRWV